MSSEAPSDAAGPSRAEATVLSAPSDVEIRIGADAPLDHVMSTMRAMRRLRTDPVPDELLDDLVRAATWAPSGSDGQHYAFVVVTDREVMAQLGELWRGVVDTYRTLAGTVVPDFTDERHGRMEAALRHQAEHFDDTPALIAACYRKDRPSASTLTDVRRNVELVRRLGFGRLRRLAAGLRTGANLGEASSIYPAVQNLLLAARANGLAANVTIWHIFDEPGFRDVLGVPKDHGIYALVPIGWPAGNFGPVRRRPIDEVRHRDRWGSGES
ncbi:MAG: nitroreductase family protein [Actinomycetota bacterium]